MSEWEELPETARMARPLRIVLPAMLGEAALLRNLVLTIEETRADLARQMRRCALALREMDEDDPRGDWWSSKIEGLQMASESLEICLLDGLRAWDQLESDHPCGVAEEKADKVSLPAIGERPEFPLPDGPEDQTLGERLMKAVRKERDDLVRQAISANEKAFGLTPDGPEFGEHMARAKAWAMAADRLETMLAQAHGQSTAEAHTRFTEEHGPWLSRLVFP